MAKKKVSDEDFMSAIVDYQMQNGFVPCIREIGQMVGMTSPASVKARFDALVYKGQIIQKETMPRAYRVKALWNELPFSDCMECSICGNVVNVPTDFCCRCGCLMEEVSDEE